MGYSASPVVGFNPFEAAKRIPSVKQAIEVTRQVNMGLKDYQKIQLLEQQSQLFKGAAQYLGNKANYEQVSTYILLPPGGG